jgi:transcriptional regulator with XRE-family HTH domain
MCINSPMGKKNPPSALARDKARQLGEQISIARRRRRLTQAMLAERAGTSRITITKLEAGNAGVALSTLLEVLAVLDPGMLDRLVDGVATDRIGETLSLRDLPKRVVPDDDF